METFVLIHGAFCESWYWRKVIPLLEKAGHRVIALDLPGHGKNKKAAADEITLQTYTDYVAGVLDKQPEPVILVGHSMGGIVISQTAEYRPDKIKKLVYLCAFLLKDGESLKSKGGGHHDPLNAPYSALKELFLGDCSDEDVRQFRARMVPEPGTIAGATIHITDKNHGRVPRVYIECLRDNAILPSTQKQMYTDMPCERVITMDTSHMPNLSAPEELAKNLISVIAG
jgi:pimeloyl-ACP methyl ester carboxylesterase